MTDSDVQSFDENSVVRYFWKRLDVCICATAVLRIAGCHRLLITFQLQQQQQSKRTHQ